ncbi:DNA/RNA helicase [Paenibacillus periandrae]|uniref:DNA/RNA helicase n=1 Tax=Paenibacillus periandrae TaxID=1761741 RepID=UPI001F0993B2|nr:DNA/RNA helicase [Paenibacillus periandrae]
MSSVPIVFRFQDDGAAALAYDTLLEIGYHAHQDVQEGQWIVQVFVDHSELTSALEIAQAHGGELLLSGEGTAGDEDDDSGVFIGGNLTDAAGGQLFNTAYGLDMIPIPAHLVNEDEVADAAASD